MIETRQRGGEMNLVPLTVVLEHYRLLYKNELKGKLSDSYQQWSLEERTNRIAAKIYTSCLLSTLLELGPIDGQPPRAAVIGRMFYLPSKEIPNEKKGLSNVNTGMIRIPNLGVFVIDLGGKNGAEIQTTKGESLKLIYSDCEVKMLPLSLISAIRVFAEDVGYAIDAENFPHEFKHIPCDPNIEYQKELAVFFQKVKEKNQEHVRLLIASDERNRAQMEAMESTLEKIGEGTYEYVCSASEPQPLPSAKRVEREHQPEDDYRPAKRISIPIPASEEICLL